MTRLVHSSLVLVVLFWTTSVAWSYQISEPTNGGRITGIVTLRGQIPQPRAFPMVLYPHGEFCKKLSDGNGHVLLKEFNVDSSGALQDVVVAVQNVSHGKAFRSRDTDLETVNCMFHPADVPESEQFAHREGHLVHIHPLVTVMRDPSLLTVANRDPIVHAAQVYQAEKGNRVLSFPIPVSYRPNSGYVDLEKGKRIVQIICGMHEYMQTWAWVVDNPYFAKTHAGGGFAIDKLPPGTYRVLAWHPHMKPIVKEVVVPADGAVTLDFEFDASQVVRPIYETQEQFRIPPTRDPAVDLSGCEGPYCVKREHDHH